MTPTEGYFVICPRCKTPWAVPTRICSWCEFQSPDQDERDDSQ